MVVVKFFGCDVALATIAGRASMSPLLRPSTISAQTGISDESPNLRGLETVRSADAARPTTLMLRFSVTADPLSVPSQNLRGPGSARGVE